MEKYFSDSMAWDILNAYSKEGFDSARKAAAENGLAADTIILAHHFNLALQVLEKLYNPADKGKGGKWAEVAERVTRWQEGGRTWAHWSEFHARKSGRADIGDNTEMKTGSGDWLYSYKSSDRESIIAEYRHKQTFIHWATDDFTIECTWEEFLDYLESYNDKGLATWFKSNVRYNPMLSKTVVQMQEYRSSKKKLAFLQDCPYCI